MSPASLPATAPGPALAAAPASVALVIGSGNVKCAAAIGALRVLQRAGIPINRVVGCSGGALYAALIALGHGAEQCQALTESLWTAEVTRPRHRLSLLRTVMPGLLRFRADRYGLRDDRRIMRRLRQVFAGSQIQDTRVPLHIVATDFTNGEAVELSTGPVVDAVRASIAIPFAFAPWRVGGRLLVDGFLADPLPVGVAVKHGAQVIVAMGFESPYQDVVDSPGRFAFQLSAIMANNLMRSRFAFQSMAHHGEVVSIIPEFTQPIGLFDTTRIPDIIEEGERATEAQLPYLKALLAQVRAPAFTG